MRSGKSNQQALLNEDPYLIQDQSTSSLHQQQTGGFQNPAQKDTVVVMSEIAT